MAEEAAGGPFGEFDFGFDFGAEPGVVGHFVGRYALTAVQRTIDSKGNLRCRVRLAGGRISRYGCYS